MLGGIPPVLAKRGEALREALREAVRWYCSVQIRSSCRDRVPPVSDVPSPIRSKPATMAEIARQAGVALSTVSYVLSGKRTVSPEIRERVLTAVAELDYRPHRPARALASGASHTIGLFLPSSQWQLIP